MSQEDEDRKTFQKMTIGFSVLIIATYYKEFILGYLISPPDPGVIGTFNEFLD